MTDNQTGALSRAVADVLRQLKASRRFSQQEMADAAGLTQSSMSRSLRGERSLLFDELVSLADMFDVTPEYIIMRAREEMALQSDTTGKTIRFQAKP